MFNFLKKNKLKGKVAIVTGGSMGIGKAIATLLAKKGCKVTICARNEKQLQEAKKEISRYTDVLAVKADVSDIKDVKKVIKETVNKFKKINILVNNAGILIYGPFINYGMKEINEIVDINLKGVLYCSREALPYLEKEQHSRIISISSGLGKSGGANFAAYSASKFGIIGFTESVAKELKNVKAYAVCPGMTNTRMLKQVWEGDYSTVDKPEDVAEVVVQLCYTGCKVKNGSAVELH